MLEKQNDLYVHTMTKNTAALVRRVSIVGFYVQYCNNMNAFILIQQSGICPRPCLFTRVLVGRKKRKEKKNNVPLPCDASVRYCINEQATPNTSILVQYKKPDQTS